MIAVASIVEGDGEVAALPVRLRRLRDWRTPSTAVNVLHPIRVRRERFLNREQELGQVMACYRYIEMNPVRSGMVESAGDYRHLDPGTLSDVRGCLRTGTPRGNDHFRETIEVVLKVEVGDSSKGRPRKADDVVKVGSMAGR